MMICLTFYAITAKILNLVISRIACVQIEENMKKRGISSLSE